MADKRLDQVTKVTDMAYVPVIMADGSIGQIAKADLASVVAGQMKSRKLFPFAEYATLETSANDISVSGTYSVMGNGTQLDLPLDYGVLISFNMTGYFTAQICLFNRDVYCRSSDNGVWKTWVKLSVQ